MTFIPYYHQNYLEALDLIIQCIKDRFEQPGYAVYHNLEQLLLKASQMANVDSEFDFVCSLYKDDFQPEVLRTHLPIFGIDFQQFHKNKYGDQSG